MIRRGFEAILLDIDGTLVTDPGTIRPRTLASLGAVVARGVRVMLATGRSESGVVDVLEQLGLDTLAVVFNGAGLYCPVRGRLVEERVLSERLVRETLAFAGEAGALPIVMRAGAKFAHAPRSEEERLALDWLEDLSVVGAGGLPREHLLRITVLSNGFRSSDELLAAFERRVAEPTYSTHFPLSALAGHRESPLLVLDVQPPCRGKGEALRVLRETYGIPPSRVVAVGDANNDVPMLEDAGLAVAMGNAFPSARAVADRTIGDNNSDAIADLVEELF